MERVISYTSKVRHLLECVSKHTDFSESWNEQMEVFVPYLSESFFCLKIYFEITASLQKRDPITSSAVSVS